MKIFLILRLLYQDLITKSLDKYSDIIIFPISFMFITNTLFNQTKKEGERVPTLEVRDLLIDHP